ncbi:endonuclease/exonuclease/phosphatase family protein [Ancylostoma caninum]|uniref:Endonuclease/exonuclease/phosphatase family protein n=1 Tax=Ancylostoma caninum TaxID=29170 RepID=A0A368FAG5_ANCCA|nr:endonuclease/exonuclease/phosphatase family protein [Ancylostoma caninum]
MITCKALNFYFGTGEEDSNDEEAKGDVAASESTRSSYHQNGPVDLTGLEVSLVSWNVDGLDGNSLATRMKAVYKVVSNLNPDFVFLQEVVGRELPTIERLSKLYDIYYSNKDYLYFTAILVSKIFEVDSHYVIHYQNSGMGRTLQIIEISNVPRGLADAWLAAGADKQTQFTWDTRKNDNKQAFGARTRFDRIFWYGPLSRVKFSLAGQQRIRSCLCFPSDHWAVHCEFS